MSHELWTCGSTRYRLTRKILFRLEQGLLVSLSRHVVVDPETFCVCHEGLECRIISGSNRGSFQHCHVARAYNSGGTIPKFSRANPGFQCSAPSEPGLENNGPMYSVFCLIKPTEHRQDRGRWPVNVAGGHARTIRAGYLSAQFRRCNAPSHAAVGTF
jgi:hypothetical protein